MGLIHVRDKKIGISYGRYSVRNKQDIDHQQGVINRHAEKHGIIIMNHYHDIIYPGIEAGRPQLQRMMAYLQSNGTQVNHLLIHSLDRLVRDTKHNIRTTLEVMDYIDTVVLVSEQVTYTANDFKFLATSLIRPSLGAGF